MITTALTRPRNRSGVQRPSFVALTDAAAPCKDIVLIERSCARNNADLPKTDVSECNAPPPAAEQSLVVLSGVFTFEDRRAEPNYNNIRSTKTTRLQSTVCATRVDSRETNAPLPLIAIVDIVRDLNENKSVVRVSARARA